MEIKFTIPDQNIDQAQKTLSDAISNLPASLNLHLECFGALATIIDLARKAVVSQAGNGGLPVSMRPVAITAHPIESTVKN